MTGDGPQVWSAVGEILSGPEQRQPTDRFIGWESKRNFMTRVVGARKLQWKNHCRLAGSFFMAATAVGGAAAAWQSSNLRSAHCVALLCAAGAATPIY